MLRYEYMYLGFVNRTRGREYITIRTIHLIMKLVRKYTDRYKFVDMVDKSVKSPECTTNGN